MEFSQEAVKEFENMQNGSGKGNKVRISSSKGCCGPSFAFDVVEKENDGGIKAGNGNFQIWAEPAAYDLLKDFRILFQDGEFFIQKLDK